MKIYLRTALLFVQFDVVYKTGVFVYKNFSGLQYFVQEVITKMLFWFFLFMNEIKI